MTTAAAIETTLRPSRREPLPGLRLVRAELLKLCTRRGLVLASLALTVGVVLVAYAILDLLHATDSAKHGPAGGVEHFRNGIYMLTQLGTMAAILIGATAGAGDLAAGVFRSLVVTGRSRLALYAARIPGGLALLLPIAAAAYALTAAGCVVFAGSLPRPGTTYLAESGLWLLLYLAVMFLLALGVSALLGSRATPIGLLAGLQLLVTPLVQGINHAGVGAEGVLGIALWQLAPKALQQGAPPSDLAMSLGGIVTVLVVWVAASVGFGAWRTVTRDA
jgi:ABC-type transport system involved in multi-copper enzyme maturation permease subunit